MPWCGHTKGSTVRLESQNQARRRWRAKNPARANAYRTGYYYRDRAKELFLSARRRAKHKGIEFSIEESDIVIPEYCPALGLKLSAESQGRKWGSPNSPSVDRIDPSKGYVKGNVQVLSWRANSLKKNETAQELRMLSDFMLKKGG